MSYIPVTQVKVALLLCLMLCQVLQRLAQGSVFLQQVLLTVHKGVLQITRSDAPPSELAAVDPCLRDAVHPQLHRQTVKVGMAGRGRRRKGKEMSCGDKCADLCLCCCACCHKIRVSTTLHAEYTGPPLG